MASRGVAFIVFLLSLNLLCSTMVSATTYVSGTCKLTDLASLKLCLNVAGILQIPPNANCCTVLDGLLDLEAAICICAAIKADLLGLLNILTFDLTAFINGCSGRSLPSGYKCA